MEQSSFVKTACYTIMAMVAGVVFLGGGFYLYSMHVDREAWDKLSDRIMQFNMDRIREKLARDNNIKEFPSFCAVSSEVILAHRITGLKIQGYGKSLSDISSLSDYSLSNLSLSGNDITDLSALKGMELEYVDLANNPNLKDIRVFKGMKSLKMLCISGTAVEDLSPLEGLRLECLNIENTPAQRKEQQK